MAGFLTIMRNLLRSIGVFGASSPTAPGHIPSEDAAKRGIELLIGNLSPLQRERCESLRCFEVTGSATGKRYRTRNGSRLNVEELDRKGRCVGVLCFLPERGVPVGDVML